MVTEIFFPLEATAKVAAFAGDPPGVNGMYLGMGLTVVPAFAVSTGDIDKDLENWFEAIGEAVNEAAPSQLGSYVSAEMRNIQTGNDGTDWTASGLLVLTANVVNIDQAAEALLPTKIRILGEYFTAIDNLANETNDNFYSEGVINLGFIQGLPNTMAAYNLLKNLGG